VILSHVNHRDAGPERRDRIVTIDKNDKTIQCQNMLALGRAQVADAEALCVVLLLVGHRA